MHWNKHKTVTFHYACCNCIIVYKFTKIGSLSSTTIYVCNITYICLIFVATNILELNRFSYGNTWCHRYNANKHGRTILYDIFAAMYPFFFSLLAALSHKGPSFLSFIVYSHPFMCHLAKSTVTVWHLFFSPPIDSLSFSPYYAQPNTSWALN